MNAQLANTFFPHTGVYSLQLFKGKWTECNETKSLLIAESAVTEAKAQQRVYDWSQIVLITPAEGCRIINRAQAKESDYYLIWGISIGSWKVDSMEKCKSMQGRWQKRWSIMEEESSSTALLTVCGSGIIFLAPPPILSLLLLFAKWVCIFPVPTPGMVSFWCLQGSESILIQSRKLQATQQKKKTP